MNVTTNIESHKDVTYSFKNSQLLTEIKKKLGNDV